MTALAVLLTLALAADPTPPVAPAPAAAWTLEFEEPGLKVLSQSHEGSDVKEVKAEVEFDIPPLEARAVVTDKSFSAKLPYVGEFRVINKTDDQHDTTYMRLKFPIIDDRDYFLDNAIVSDLQADGSGEYLKQFKLAAQIRPARSGIVRIPLCVGSWSLKASATPGKTSAVYHLLTDPGGWIPSSLTNIANRRAVPDLVRALHAEMKRRAALKAALEAARPASAAPPPTPPEAAATR